jgi:hypothetical protein
MGLLILAGCAKAEVAASEPSSPEPVAPKAEVQAAEETEELAPLECPKGTERRESLDSDIVFCAEIRRHTMVLEGPVRWTSRLARKEGVLRLAGEFTRGYPTGLWQEWNARTGAPRARGEFAPVTDGPVIELYVGVSIGVMHMRLWNLERQFWREPGLSVGGRRHGEWTVWYRTRNGEAKACEGRFVDDQRDGEWRCWYPSGDVWWRGEYKGGRKDGNWHVNRSSGRHWASATLRMGVLHGEYRRSHDNRVPAAKGQYSRGQKIGKWTYWGTDGRRLRKDPWQLELPEFYPDDSELQLLAHVEHGVPGERFMALQHLIAMAGRQEHELTRQAWLRERQRERAEEGHAVVRLHAPTLGPMLLLALYDMEPRKYLDELRRLHTFRYEGEPSGRYKSKSVWRGAVWMGGVFEWVGETGYRLMLRGELPTGDAAEATRHVLFGLAASPSLANRRRAAEVFAKFEGIPAFDPEVIPGIPFENAAVPVTHWLEANLGTCKWNRKAQVYRCNPATP